MVKLQLTESLSAAIGHQGFRFGMVKLQLFRDVIEFPDKAMFPLWHGKVATKPTPGLTFSGMSSFRFGMVKLQRLAATQPDNVIQVSALAW